MNTNYKTINKFAKILFALSVIMAMIAGCQKTFEMDLPLAVSSRDLSLTKDAGSTHVLVYSTGEWKARFTRNVTWASLNRLQGYGNSEVVFTYAANYGISRKVGIVFEKGELADTVMFTQAGSVTEPSLSFATSAVTLLRAQAGIFVPINTNLRYSMEDIEATVAYYDENGQLGESVTPWVSDVSIAYEGVSFDVAANDGQMPRSAVLTLSIKDAAENVTRAELTITQSIADPVFKLESNEGTYEGYSQDCLVSASNNNIGAYADKIEFNVSYDSPVEEGGEWVLDPALTAEGLGFSLNMNDGSEVRSATLSMSFTDSNGNSVSESFRVTQKAYPEALSFSEVRSLTPGEISVLGYIEGFVVSAPESKNIMSSPQTGEFSFDREENDRTAYFESTDGQYGFCLKFKTKEDNVLERFSKVRISLAGTVLEKKDSPECYTISGLTTLNILEASVPDEFKVPVKNKTISELTDADIFTLVSISGLEIMCKDGAYTNCTDGYSLKDDVNPIGTTTPKWDVAPLLCYDQAGSSIFMLTNAAVSWRRFSSGPDLEFNTLVPQGSGTFRGIVVADDMAPVRYGDLGRYQLRAMTEEEIDLDDEPFSKTIVEWNWNDRIADLDPEVGEGELNIYGAEYAGTLDFNNVVCSGKGGSSSEQKGLVDKGAINLTQQWWDFDSDEGKYFDISFQTSGISGSNMIFGIVWGHGSMSNSTISGPSHWNLLYSVDGGATFNPVPGSEIIKKRSIVWWSGTPKDATPGFTEHLRKLPSDCFGKEKVVLRLQVADKVTDALPDSPYPNNFCIEKGTLTESVNPDNSQARIGTITVRYN